MDIRNHNVFFEKRGVRNVRLASTTFDASNDKLTGHRINAHRFALPLTTITLYKLLRTLGDIAFQSILVFFPSIGSLIIIYPGIRQTTFFCQFYPKNKYICAQH